MFPSLLFPGDSGSTDLIASGSIPIAFVRAIESLSPGEVVSYGDIAARAGYPNRHRAVGQLLSVSLDALPWWRVVYASGHFPPCHPGLQEGKLIDEGVEVAGFRVIRAPEGRFRDPRLPS